MKNFCCQMAKQIPVHPQLQIQHSHSESCVPVKSLSIDNRHYTILVSNQRAGRHWELDNVIANWEREIMRIMDVAGRGDHVKVHFLVISSRDTERAVACRKLG